MNSLDSCTMGEAGGCSQLRAKMSEQGRSGQIQSPVRTMAALWSIAALVAGCGPAPAASEAPDKVTPVARFEGAPLSGGPADAKGAGYTDCAIPDGGNGYYGFTCAKPKPSIAGVAALSAKLSLGYDSAATEADRVPEKSRYQGLTFEFAEAHETYPCEVEGPFGCPENPDQPLVRLARNLIADGWLWESTRYGDDFYKPGQLILLRMSSRHDDGRTSVEISEISSTDLAEHLGRIAARRNAQLKDHEANAKFIQSMKADAAKP